MGSFSERAWSPGPLEDNVHLTPMSRLDPEQSWPKRSALVSTQTNLYRGCQGEAYSPTGLSPFHLCFSLSKHPIHRHSVSFSYVSLVLFLAFSISLFILIYTKQEHEVAQLCPTLRDPMDCSPSDSSVHGDPPGRNTGVGCHSLLQDPQTFWSPSTLFTWAEAKANKIDSKLQSQIYRGEELWYECGGGGWAEKEKTQKGSVLTWTTVRSLNTPRNKPTLNRSIGLKVLS